MSQFTPGAVRDQLDELEQKLNEIAVRQRTSRLDHAHTKELADVKEQLERAMQTINVNLVENKER